eukprot:gene2528-3233_t
MKQISYDDVYDEKYTGNINSSLIWAILKYIIKHNVDLLHFSFPSFVLEKRSFLEKYSDLLLHQDYLIDLYKSTNGYGNIMNVSKWYLSPWYLTPYPFGVAKPYNPILGEVFISNFRLSDGSTTQYFAEQVSHHPPISAVYAVNEKNKFEIKASVSPNAALHVFSNSATISMKGCYFLIIDKKEIYEITPPTILVKNIFFGQIKMGYTGKSFIKCKKTGFEANIEWDVDRIEMKVYQDGTEISRVFGNVHEELDIESHFGSIEQFMDIHSLKNVSKEVVSNPRYAEEESRNVWYNVSKAINDLDYDEADVEKNIVEGREREKRKTHPQESYVPKLFCKQNNEFIFKQ